MLRSALRRGSSSAASTGKPKFTVEPPDSGDEGDQGEREAESNGGAGSDADADEKREDDIDEEEEADKLTEVSEEERGSPQEEQTKS